MRLGVLGFLGRFGFLLPLFEERAFVVLPMRWVVDLRGTRVADFDAIPAGRAFVRVTLVRAGGEPAASRDYLLDVQVYMSLTAIITASCEGVTCPAADDVPEYTACQGGRCVDPRCSPEAPDFCPAPACVDDVDCASPVLCGGAVCSAGLCFVVPDDARCPAGEVCDIHDGCVEGIGPSADAGPPLTDGGPGCASTETACHDGRDEDCDGATDCADADCDGATCDDGSFCNGADTCSGGACSAHAGSPCSAFCNEAEMACEECATDSDCGAVVYGTWGTCGGFSGTCDATGTQSRSVSTPSCMSGACETVPSTEDRGCTRGSRDGRNCGSTVYGAYGACGGYSSTCDETGTQSRSVTSYACGGGSCNSSVGSQSRGCSRSTDGDACVVVPGCPARCAGGLCEPICAGGCPC